MTIEPATIWRRWRNTAIVVGFFGLIVVGLPVLLPYAMITRWRAKRRVRLAARAFRCPGCGEPVGDGAIELAGQRWKSLLDDYQRRNPGLRFHFLPHFDAVCARCNAHYAFNGQTRSFQPAAASL